jgi:hypothetical protein
VIVGSDPKRLSVSPYEDSLSACSGLTTELGCKFVRRQFRLILRHDGLVDSSWKNRSNGVDTVLAELVQEGNARKEPVKGHYETLICQGQRSTTILSTASLLLFFLAFLQSELLDRSQTDPRWQQRLQILKPDLISLFFIVCLSTERPLNLTIESSML